MVAKLITRGAGKHSSLITLGAGGFWQRLIETSRRIIRSGSSSAKRTLKEITVYVKLLRVNGQKILSNVTNQTMNFGEQKQINIKFVETKKTLDEAKVAIRKM